MWQIYLTIYYCIIMSSVSGDFIDKANAGGKLSSKFLDLKTNVVGVNYMQEEVMDKVNFQNARVNGEETITEFSEKLAAAFHNIFEAVRNMKNMAEDLYLRSAWSVGSNFEECCKVDVTKLEWSKEFNKSIAPDICYRISKDSDQDPFIPLSEELKQLMKENKQFEPSIKWQYFGTEFGTHTIYPKRKNDVCDTYDPRYRPWYVETVTPVPKDVVIVFDKSGSMKGERLHISIDAANTVINTLNPNDRVALVVFSSEATTPPGDETESCYASDMAYAIPDVKKYLRDYIKKITPGSETYYIDALERAFGIFKSVGNDPLRKKVILFLTDGEPTDTQDAILRRLSELNAEKKNSVTILTYGLGTDITEAGTTLLQKMANMTVYNSTAGDKNIGFYKEIRDTKNLRLQLGTFYNIFASQERLDTPVVTVPYTDFSGLGTITSVCLPVYEHNNILRGAVCADITISDLTWDLQALNQGEESYVFIIDDTGRTMLHPNFPSPGQHYDSDPIFLNIQYVEPEAEKHGVFEDMLHSNKESGKVEIDVEMATSRGNTTIHGINLKSVQVVYHWKNIQNTHFKICLVITTDASVVSMHTSHTADSFLYHKQTSWVGKSVCSLNNMDVTLDQSTVKFAPHAFKDIYSYIYKRETDDDLARYKAVMEGRIQEPNLFKDDVQSYVAATEQMDQFWKEAPPLAISNFFFASNNGIMRTYPGQEMAQDYDHSVQPWFVKTLTFKNELVISGPHRSDFNSELVYTISHTILQARAAGDKTIGVVGANVYTSYMKATVEHTLPECRLEDYECILIDASGFIVYHPVIEMSLLDKHYHIAEYEPVILTTLIYRGLIKQMGCTDYAWKRTYQTWKMDMLEPLDLHDEYPYIFISRILQSNLYICIKDKQQILSPDTCESCNQYDIKRCTRYHQERCHCPCYDYVKFEHCTNTFNGENTDHPCLATPTYGNGQISIHFSTKPVCFHQSCSNLVSAWDCALMQSCLWCFTNVDQEVMSCNDNVNCIETSLTTTTELPKGKTNAAAIAVPVVLVIIIIILISIIVVIYLYRRKIIFKSDAENNPPYDVVRVASLNPSSTNNPETPSFQSSNPSSETYLTNKLLQQGIVNSACTGSIANNPETVLTDENTINQQTHTVSSQEFVPKCEEIQKRKQECIPPVQTGVHTTVPTPNPEHNVLSGREETRLVVSTPFYNPAFGSNKELNIGLTPTQSSSDLYGKDQRPSRVDVAHISDTPILDNDQASPRSGNISDIRPDSVQQQISVGIQHTQYNDGSNSNETLNTPLAAPSAHGHISSTHASGPMKMSQLESSATRYVKDPN